MSLLSDLRVPMVPAETRTFPDKKCLLEETNVKRCDPFSLQSLSPDPPFQYTSIHASQRPGHFSQTVRSLAVQKAWYSGHRLCAMIDFINNLPACIRRKSSCLPFELLQFDLAGKSTTLQLRGLQLNPNTAVQSPKNVSGNEK